MLSGEHFTNFFLNALPQVVIGMADRYKIPAARWLNIEGNEILGEPGLASHLAERLMAGNYWPALSYEMEPDHGFLTVHHRLHRLDPTWQLPLVPVVMNCTTPPLMTLRQSYDFGVAVGEAIRSYQGLDRIALVGGGGLSHFVGEPRVGDIDEEFDHWFLEQLGKDGLGELLDLPNDELMEAGNGTGEVRAWVAVAAAMRGHKMTTLSYEPIYEWINGMGVVSYSAA
jgi:hypothetical protein